MAKNAYNVEGDFQMGRNRQHFTLTVVGDTEDDARERTFTELGSRHAAKRRDVSINTVTQADPASIDGVTQKRLGN